MLVLEGIYLFPSEDGFDLAVVHRGLVHVSVPTGMVLPAFKAGDQIVVVVTVSASGKFSFVKGQSEGRMTRPPARGIAYGPLVERLPVLGRRQARERRDAPLRSAGRSRPLVLRLGDKVKLYCGLAKGVS